MYKINTHNMCCGVRNLVNKPGWRVVMTNMLYMSLVNGISRVNLQEICIVYTFSLFYPIQLNDLRWIIPGRVFLYNILGSNASKHWTMIQNVVFCFDNFEEAMLTKCIYKVKCSVFTFLILFSSLLLLLLVH